MRIIYGTILAAALALSVHGAESRAEVMDMVHHKDLPFCASRGGECFAIISDMRKDLEKLNALGRSVAAPKDYDPAVLDAFANRHPGRDYWVTFTAPEFTTLCPKTGQPDFATLTIRYIPAKKLVESKSLKLYLFGFRNHGDFHEDVVNVIYDDLVKLLRPKYMEVYGKFAARGGITIDPFVNGGAGAKYKALAAKRFESWSGVRG